MSSLSPYVVAKADVTTITGRPAWWFVVHLWYVLCGMVTGGVTCTSRQGWWPLLAPLRKLRWTSTVLFPMLCRMGWFTRADAGYRPAVHHGLLAPFARRRFWFLHGREKQRHAHRCLHSLYLPAVTTPATLVTC
jgi:hypothetical protein